jgi:hypothetical protein
MKIHQSLLAATLIGTLAGSAFANDAAPAAPVRSPPLRKHPPPHQQQQKILNKKLQKCSNPSTN